MGKQEMRKKLAALSFSEKVKILEKLRERSLAFAEPRRKRKEAQHAHDAAPSQEIDLTLEKIRQKK